MGKAGGGERQGEGLTHNTHIIQGVPKKPKNY